MADQNTSSKNRNNQVNLVDILLYLLRYWYWFLLCIGIAVGITYYYYAKTPFVYRSDVTVVIKNPENTQRTVRLENYSNNINNVNITTQILELRSKSLVQNVVEALDVDFDYTIHKGLRDIELYRDSPVWIDLERKDDNLPVFSGRIVLKDASNVALHIDSGKAIEAALGDTISIGGRSAVLRPGKGYSPEWYGKAVQVRKIPTSSAVNAFRSRLRVTQAQSDESILTISLQDYSLERANDFLVMLVEKYNDDAIREKNRIAVQTAAFINERIGIIEEELGDVEKDLAKFKSSQRLMDVDETASGYLSEARVYDTELLGIETRLAMADYIRDYVTKHYNSFDMIPFNTGLDDRNADQAIAKYNELVLTREKLVEASSTESPAVKQVESSMLAMKNNIIGIIDNLKVGLDIRKKDIQKQENASLKKFTAMPSKAREMLSIERQQKIKESLYMFLLNKREENALTQAMVDNNARMIDTAEGSSVPVSPSREKMMILAFLIGILIPAIILLLKLFLDTRVHTRKEIEETISVPFLAEIPLKKKRKNKGGKESLVEYDPNSKGIFTEAFRMMCTNLDFMKPTGTGSAVVSMTSASVSAGKTFVTTNMAACLADAKKKVILLDLDLRKRTLSAHFGLRKHVNGVSNYIYDEAMTLDDVIKKDMIPGVDFIPAGHTPPNPAELLNRPRFETLINDLKKVYDYVILDGVPFNVVADPMVINRVVDMNLYVIRSGQMDRRGLPDVEELYNSGRLNNMAIVLNGSEIVKGYGYGAYGYGEKDD